MCQQPAGMTGVWAQGAEKGHRTLMGAVHGSEAISLRSSKNSQDLMSQFPSLAPP